MLKKEMMMMSKKQKSILQYTSLDYWTSGL